MKSLLISLCILVLFILPSQPAAEPVTTGSLIIEMIDMFRLAEFPSPFYKTVQYSSYDHRSTLPGDRRWFENSDGFGREPVPNFEAVVREPDSTGVGEYLICDVNGPGAIVRVWTAAIRGTIRMYLDGAGTPVYDGPAEDFFRRPYSMYAANIGDLNGVLDGTFCQRNAAYCPIPFAKRCRIVWTGNINQIHFYQVNIRRYEPGTSVAAFTPGDLKTYEREIRRVAAVMNNPDVFWSYVSGKKPEPFDVTVEPDTFVEALTLKGPAAIERLTVLLDAGDRDLALRQTIIHVICDGARWGQVQSPVGDFFGAAPGINPYNSAPFSVSPEGSMTSRFVMPCAEEIRVVFENLGNQPVHITGEALPAEYLWNDKTSMHFYARWRIDHGLVGPMGAIQDMPYLIANGGGVYVGSAVFVLNRNEVPSPGGSWWGEGDEKVFTDEDTAPSIFGTGSEDYYNYAWSDPDIFMFPYCGQPRNDGPANRGFVTNNRWHILDDLPFRYRIGF